MNIPVCCMLTIVITSEMNLSSTQDRCVTIVLIPTLTLQFTLGSLLLLPKPMDYYDWNGVNPPGTNICDIATDCDFWLVAKIQFWVEEGGIDPISRIPAQHNSTDLI